MSSMKVDLGSEPFVLEKNNDWWMLKLRGIMDPDLAKEFERRMKKEFETLNTHLIIDLTQVDDLLPAWSRIFMQLVTGTKNIKKRIIAISTKEPVRLFIHQQGISASLPMVSTLDLALKELLGKKEIKLDVEFVNPFLEGAISVLKIQANTVVKAGSPVLKKPDEPFYGDISGVIGIVADSFKGSIVITFPETTFLNIMSNMLGETFKTLTPEIKDGAAELTNIIFGHAKTVLNNRGLGIKMAIPSVVSGHNHTISSNTKGPRISVPFNSTSGSFAIEIWLE